ncbi:hypothetical protein QQ020_25595 [Fulvivirgaceae bacterium BMA12]|uniref:Uncharacterized protein n=1 Tax=Agaribacillus aureus TaxID=3051825 RepID=A0ABT8LCJ2_9BACT|nr:hypothetical protein [Fulvivirgaceae bacterium BMA12]
MEAYMDAIEENKELYEKLLKSEQEKVAPLQEQLRKNQLQWLGNICRQFKSDV